MVRLLLDDFSTHMLGCGEVDEGFETRAQTSGVIWRDSSEEEWLFSKEFLIAGFRWSIDRIRQLP